MTEEEIEAKAMHEGYVCAVKSFLWHPEIRGLVIENDRKFLKLVKRRQNLIFFTMNFCFVLFIVLLLLEEFLAGFSMFAVGAAIAFKGVFGEDDRDLDEDNEKW